MADNLGSLASELGAQNVKSQISEKWSSLQTDFRDNLRKALRDFTDCDAVLDNKNVFKYSDGYFSISHSEKAGGFVTSDIPVGLDIETRHRKLSEKAYARISDEDERQLGFSPIELWVAKEASFKALNSVFYSENSPSPDFSLKTISQIKITSKQRFNSEFASRFTYKLRNFNGLEGRLKGLLISQNETCLGVSLILP